MTTSNLPRTVWALGFVSLFMDISSEMIHGLLPIFLVTQLGISALTLGVIEGFAEAIALFMKTFSGIISDWCRKRKTLIVIGYLLAAVTKPVFALSTSLSLIVGARFIDRMGKGIRGAPRDALIADVTPLAQRGAAFGLRQSLDTWGAVIGPLIAMVGMLLFADNFSLVFALAILPAFISVLILIRYVKEPERHESYSSLKVSLHFKAIKQFPKAFWFVLILMFIFTLARFSEAFLLLRAQSVGLETAFIPLVLVIMSGAYALSAYPFGKYSDKIGRRWLLIFSLLLLIAADIVLAFANSFFIVAIGIIFWGLHMGASQGILSALVADTSTQNLRGTAFGLFSLSASLAMLLASIIAGGLWVTVGAMYTFFGGAGFAFLALLLVVVKNNKY